MKTTIEIDLTAHPDLAECEPGEELFGTVTANDGATLTVDIVKEYDEEDTEEEPEPAMRGKKRVAPAVAILLAGKSK